MKMEQTVCSETSAHTIQMPGNYPEEGIQQLLRNFQSLYRTVQLVCQQNSQSRVSQIGYVLKEDISILLGWMYFFLYTFQSLFHCQITEVMLHVGWAVKRIMC